MSGITSFFRPLTILLAMTALLTMLTPRQTAAQQSAANHSIYLPLVAQAPGASSSGYLTSLQELAQRRQLASQGVEPYKSAVADAIGFANGKLGSRPSPQQPLNIPDTGGPFVDDTTTAYGLALAYGVTGDMRYAQKAREFIMAWVNTTRSTENTAAASVLEITAPSSRASCQFIPSSQCTAAAVTTVLTATPTVASTAAGARTLRMSLKRVVRPPSTRMTASAAVPRSCPSWALSNCSPNPSSPTSTPTPRNSNRLGRPMPVARPTRAAAW